MNLEFHKGIDYAVVMKPSQTTDAPLAALYGQDRDVTKFGQMFAASPNMLKALQEIETMPFSMVNDSESLRHTIRQMQQIARAACKLT